MQDVGRRYVRVINGIYGRSGSLWEGRFKSSLIDSERYLLTCHRYIEQNPVRAHMVQHVAAYPWSSHGHYAGARVDRLIAPYEQFKALGRTAEERRSVFNSLFAQPLPQHVLDEIRIAINTDSALGTDAFMNDAEAKLGRSVRPPQRGRPRKDVTEKLL